MHRWHLPGLFCLLLGIGHGLEMAFDAVGLMDVALSHVSALSGRLSPQEETEVVLRLLRADADALLLAKHFGALPSYETHLRASLKAQGATSGAAPLLEASTAPSDDALFLRRSVVKYDTARQVPDALVQRALNAAVLAPNHFLTEPWRFYLAGPETRATLAALNEAKREAFSQVPGWLIVSVLPSGGDISSKKGLEDYAATACAVQNFMLSLASQGVGSKWMTGALGSPAEAVLKAVGADTVNEVLVGVIWFGWPATPLASVEAPARKKGLDGVLKQLA